MSKFVKTFDPAEADVVSDAIRELESALSKERNMLHGYVDVDVITRVSWNGERLMCLYVGSDRPLAEWNARIRASCYPFLQEFVSILNEVRSGK